MRWAREAVLVAAEIVLRTDHNVSRTSPSTTPAPRYIIRGPSVKALVFVTMNVKESNCMQQCDMIWDLQEVVALDPVFQELAVLAANIVDMQNQFDKPYVGSCKGFTKRPIHVHLLLPLLKINQ